MIRLNRGLAEQSNAYFEHETCTEWHTFLTLDKELGKFVMIKAASKLDHLVKSNIVEHHPFFSSNADRYLKWAPVFCVFLSNAFGLPCTHTLLDRLKILSLSHALQRSTVYALKQVVDEVRPGISFDTHSFPSGHTATSFMGAEVLRTELKNDYPLISMSGYACAVTTAIFRLYKNKHWMSDVVVGAAIGVLSVRIGYILLKKVKLVKAVETDTTK